MIVYFCFCVCVCVFWCTRVFVDRRRLGVSTASKQCLMRIAYS